MSSANAVESFLEGICKPLLLYVVFMTALMSYNITQGDAIAAGKNMIFTIAGSVMLFLLCFTGFETAAWILLAIPPFFFTAIIALLVITQIVRTDVKFENGSSAAVTGDKIKEILGLNEDKGDSSTGDDPEKLVGKPYHEPCDDEPPERPPPRPPKYPSQRRIADAKASTKEQPACSSCNMCDTCS